MRILTGITARYRLTISCDMSGFSALVAWPYLVYSFLEVLFGKLDEFEALPCRMPHAAVVAFFVVVVTCLGRKLLSFG